MQSVLSTLAQQTLENKKVERNKYIIVPHPEEIDDWTILEARSRGVPHAVYYDTSNKISFFPCDIPGYESKFSKDMFAWSDGNGWLEHKSDKLLVECERVFKELQQYFKEQGIDSYILCIRGSCKGHVSVAINEEPGNYDDISLWVYTSNDSLIGSRSDIDN